LFWRLDFLLFIFLHQVENPDSSGAIKENEICRKSIHLSKKLAFYCSFSLTKKTLSTCGRARLCKNWLKIYAQLKAKNLSR
jgi:hypothetical protein